MLRRSTIVVVILVAAIALAIVSAPDPPQPTERLEPRAMDSIDFSQLDPPLAQFIQLTRDHKTIGRQTSDFPDLWQYELSHKGEPQGGGYVFTQFSLPMTKERRAEYDLQNSTPGAVPCWPMLGIRVDTSSSTIVGVTVYSQCL